MQPGAHEIDHQPQESKNIRNYVLLSVLIFIPQPASIHNHIGVEKLYAHKKMKIKAIN